MADSSPENVIGADIARMQTAMPAATLEPVPFVALAYAMGACLVTPFVVLMGWAAALFLGQFFHWFSGGPWIGLPVWAAVFGDPALPPAIQFFLPPSAPHGSFAVWLTAPHAELDVRDFVYRLLRLANLPLAIALIAALYLQIVMWIEQRMASAGRHHR